MLKAWTLPAALAQPRPSLRNRARFERLRQASRIKAWAVPNFDVAGKDELFAIEGGPLCCQRGALEPESVIRKEQQAVMAYSRRSGLRHLLQSAVLKGTAQEKGVTPAQVALMWHGQAVLSIHKVGTVAQIERTQQRRRFSLANLT